jgi:hypothetical protein
MLNARTAIFALAGIAAAAAATPIFSNNIGGDSFTNAGTSNTGQVINSGWYYNNVRNSGIVGINGTYARSGNGSVYLEGSFGPGGNSSKADVELLVSATANGNGNFNSNGALGRLADLTSFGYDWYRDSISTNDSIQHPSLRLQVISQDSSQFGYLVFERIYNGFGTAPTDSWQTDDVYANRSSYVLWATGSIANAGTYQTTLDQWMTSSANYFVLNVSSGFGSGWGPFRGAVDNISVGFNGDNTTYNFEVVPAPGTAAVAGIAGLMAARRRR